MHSCECIANKTWDITKLSTILVKLNVAYLVNEPEVLLRTSFYILQLHNRAWPDTPVHNYHALSLQDLLILV
jgi:hypothetical protein